MKNIPFTKMCGAGNDFIVMEGLKTPKVKDLAVAVCDRTDGIGADGLLLLDKSKVADYKMRIINADGSQAEMCGNGARCLAAYIKRIKKPKKERFSMETLAGVLQCEANGEIANVRLSDPKDYQSDITIPLGGRDLHVSYIDTGVPHTIIYVDSLKDINVKAIGENVRYHKRFQPRGTNVNFVEQIDRNLIDARTYERGVEDETKACGTGSVAAAIVSYIKANPEVPSKKGARMNVRTRSGEILQVTFDIDRGRIREEEILIRLFGVCLLGLRAD